MSAKQKQSEIQSAWACLPIPSRHELYDDDDPEFLDTLNKYSGLSFEDVAFRCTDLLNESPMIWFNEVGSKYYMASFLLDYWSQRSLTEIDYTCDTAYIHLMSSLAQKSPKIRRIDWSVEQRLCIVGVLQEEIALMDVSADGSGGFPPIEYLRKARAQWMAQ